MSDPIDLVRQLRPEVGDNSEMIAAARSALPEIGRQSASHEGDGSQATAREAAEVEADWANNEPGKQDRSQTRRLFWVAGAAAAAALGLWGIVSLTSGDDDGATVVATTPSGSEPTTDPTVTTSAPTFDARPVQPNERGVLTILPAGPYRAGQDVVVSALKDDVGSQWNPEPTLCATVSAGQNQGDYCDVVPPQARTQSSHGDDGLRLFWVVTLNSDVFTGDGYRRCNDASVSCRLEVIGLSGSAVLSEELEFDESEPNRQLSLEVALSEAPGEYSVTVGSTEGQAAEGPYHIMLCSFGPGELASFPSGVSFPPPDLPPHLVVNCRRLGLVEPTEVSTAPTAIREPMLDQRGMFGVLGWSDCESSCFVLVSADEENIVAATLPKDDRLAPKPPPRLTVQSQGPFEAGVEIEVEVANLPAGVSGQIGLCNPASQSACAYSDERREDGVHAVKVGRNVESCSDCFLVLKASADVGEVELGAPLAFTELDAVGSLDLALTVDPAGPYEPGDKVAVSFDRSLSDDPFNDRPMICATVDGIAGESCDVDSLTSSVGPTEIEDDQIKRVFELDGDVFTGAGYRSCAEPNVHCRFLAQPIEGGDVLASARLEFTSEPPNRHEQINIELTEEPGVYAIYGELAGSVTSVQRCAFGTGEPMVDPRGQSLWLTFGGMAASATNCDAIRTDEQFTNGRFSIQPNREFFGYWGWTDCAEQVCYLRMSTGGSEWGTAALIPRWERLSVAPRPSLEIVTPGPHAAGDVIEVKVDNLPEGFVSAIGVCNPTSPWGCGYIDFDVGDGIHAMTIPASVDSCGNCYLELDSRSEGLAPLAVTALPMRS